MAEPCPECGCPGEQYDGHACEDFAPRVFTCFPLITFFAKDEDEAARMLYALNDAINATPGISTDLDEECYERVSDEHPDEPWAPTSQERERG